MGDEVIGEEVGEELVDIVAVKTVRREGRFYEM